MCLDASAVHLFFFFNDTATTEIYTLSLHDALPISSRSRASPARSSSRWSRCIRSKNLVAPFSPASRTRSGSGENGDRKSTRLNSSHSQISYAVFCLKKKKKNKDQLNKQVKREAVRT